MRQPTEYGPLLFRTARHLSDPSIGAYSGRETSPGSGSTPDVVGRRGEKEYSQPWGEGIIHSPQKFTTGSQVFLTPTAQ